MFERFADLYRSKLLEILCFLAGRFHDDSDDDLAGMESNYKQIEKEEVKR